MHQMATVRSNISFKNIKFLRTVVTYHFSEEVQPVLHVHKEMHNICDEMQL